MKDQNRFVNTHKQGGPIGAEIWVDTKTGVNYLFLREGFSAGLTALVDAEGKPVVTKENISGD